MSFEQKDDENNKTAQKFDFDELEKELAFSNYENDAAAAEIETDQNKVPLNEKPLNEDDENNDQAYGIVTAGVEPIEMTPTGSKIIGYVTADQRETVRLGTYVIIPYENENLFGKVTKLQYRPEFSSDDATEIHTQRMLAKKGSRINENDYKLLTSIDPICILYEKNKKSGLQRRMADRIPKPNTPILPVLDKEKVQVGLNIPKEGIFLGHLSVGGELVKTHQVPPTVAYYLRNDYVSGDPLIFRHMLVCGSTGTGKTFLTKNILRQFEADSNRYRLRSDPKLKSLPCLVIMDPQDEYSQLYEDSKVTEADQFSFDSEKIAYGGFQNTKTFVAKVEGENYAGKSKADQMEFTIPFAFVKKNPWILETAGLPDNQKNGLELLVEDYFKRAANKNNPSTYLGFKAFIEKPETKSEYTEQTKKIHEATYDGIVRKVLNKEYGRVFDQDAKPITELYKTLFASGQISVFPTEYINSPRIRDLIVLVMMTVIVNNKLNTSGNADIKNTPIILVLDEAHRYLSNAEGVMSGKIISKFAEAAKQGRKEGLGLFLITQDPQDIETEILKQINTKIVLNLNNDAAINAVKIPTDYEKRVPYLKKGQMIIHSPDNGDIVEITGLGNCVVKHE
ncbi:MAG: ATP-binding protein [Methanimicrococcus sp.]|nr:ATP-binding protein [Methanimicrococcus sp.]MCL2142118.1 ATP-binding protein [Methanimicrococcus sp.]